MLIKLAYYPSVAINRAMCAMRIWNQWDWVDPYLLLGAVPARRHIRRLAGLGVSAIVNLCEEFGGHAAEMTACGIEHLHLPTRDYRCPESQVLLQGADFIRRQAAAGKKTYVHCKAGQGRSAAMALCYLMASRQLSAQEAMQQLWRTRRHVVRQLHQKPPILEVERRLRGASPVMDRQVAECYDTIQER